MKKKSLITLGIAAVMGVTVLAGCSGETKKTTTDTSTPANAKELAESVVANMENISSLTSELKEVYSGEVKASGFTMGSDMNMTMDTKAYKEGDQEVAYAEMEMDYKMTGLESIIGAGNSNQHVEYEVYSIGSSKDGKYTNYAKSSDSEGWTKSEVNISVTLLSGQNSIYKAIADGKAEAKLSDGTVKVNGKDAYKMEATLTGEMFQEALGGMNLTQAANMESLDLSDLSIPVTLYIYKDTKFPAKVEMDAKEFGEKLYSQMSASTMSVAGMEVNLKEFMIEMDFDDYNEVEKFTIPQEVIDTAVESDGEEDVIEVTEASSTASAS